MLALSGSFACAPSGGGERGYSEFDLCKPCSAKIGTGLDLRRVLALGDPDPKTKISLLGQAARSLVEV